MAWFGHLDPCHLAEENCYKNTWFILNMKNATKNGWKYRNTMYLCSNLLSIYCKVKS
jgi:hypothetical protein